MKDSLSWNSTLKEETRNNIQLILLKIYIVGIFLPIKLSNIIMILMVLFWIFNADYKLLPGLIKKYKLPLLLIGYYGIHLLGLLYTDNFQLAYKELEKKIPLLIMPILVVSWSMVIAIHRKRLLRFFLITTAFFSTVLLLYAVYRYFKFQDPSYFYFKQFSELLNLNVIYLAIYVLFAFTIYFYEVKKGIYSQRKLLTRTFVYLLFLSIMMLISSKNGLAVFACISIHYILTHVTFKQRYLKPLLVAGSAIIMIVLLNTFSVTRQRIMDVVNSDWAGILDDDYTLKATSYTGATLRISFWKVTLKELKKDNQLLFGVGTGDSEDYLNSAYDKYGLLENGFRNYNLHNAFMEVVLEFGLVGLIYFLLMLFYFFTFAVRQKEIIFVFLLLIFCSFSMTESVLNVNKGLSFFSFFFSVLLVLAYFKNDSSIKAGNS